MKYSSLAFHRDLKRVFLSSLFEGTPARMEWLFTDYQVKVR